MASPSPSHKPRKRTKQQNGSAKPTLAGPNYTSSGSVNHGPQFPLAALLWPAREGTSRWITLPLILMITGLYKWSVGFWGYSGYQSPPMYGDFEAQRHWMEITNHLSISQWYFHDLEWWGLDYPPLTAYHSWILGKIGSSIDPTWFALHSARGFEDPLLKVYMRATALISEYLIFVPALILFVYRIARLQHLTNWEALVALVAILMQPATILIDHAHFQYNTVMLGFMIAALSSVLADKLMWTSIFFVAALGFKQMALYYALAIFSYLLGASFFPRMNITRLISVSVITVLAFGIVFLPIAVSGLIAHFPTEDVTIVGAPPLLSLLNVGNSSWYYPILLQLTQSIHRIFPFARGVFEDKVANFWCTLHTFHKLHRYPVALIQRASLVTTLLSTLPACLAIGLYPHRTLLPIASATTAWGFFLFSFQVHEKSVLLPLLPMTLLLAGDGGLSLEKRSWIAWANILGCWTMFPLLKRDELRVPYFVLTLLWAWLLNVPGMLLELSVFRGQISGSGFSRLIHTCFYFAMIIWHLAEAFIDPPKSKPDLWVVANVLVGTAGFSLCYIWCLWTLISSVRTRSQRYGRIPKGIGKGKIKAT